MIEDQHVAKGEALEVVKATLIQQSSCKQRGQRAATGVAHYAKLGLCPPPFDQSAL